MGSWQRLKIDGKLTERGTSTRDSLRADVKYEVTNTQLKSDGMLVTSLFIS